MKRGGGKPQMGEQAARQRKQWWVGGWVGGLEMGCAARGGEGGKVGPSGFMRGACVVSGMNHSVWPGRAGIRSGGGGGGGGGKANYI